MFKFRCVVLAMAGLLLLGLPARGDEREDCLKIIDKAIKAQGGEEKLKKVFVSTWKSKGTFSAMGMNIDYTAEWHHHMPSKSSMRLEMDIMGNKFSFAQILNGDKAWHKIGDQVQELDKDKLTELREMTVINHLSFLVPLKDKTITLSSLGEIKVDGKAAVGVKATRKGQRDVSLYFDKESGLLVKSEYRAKDPAEQEVAQEVFYSNYKEFDGVKMPTKTIIKQDGKDFINDESSDFKFPAKLEDSVFDKP